VACQNVGMPECRINLAHCVAYLAESPKSTRSYEAYNRAEQAAKAETTAPVPIHLRNAPTKLMKDLGYGNEYLYNPTYLYVLLILYDIFLTAYWGGKKDILSSKNIFRPTYLTNSS
jgi:replication-associated recombination protein RarA